MEQTILLGNMYLGLGVAVAAVSFIVLLAIMLSGFRYLDKKPESKALLQIWRWGSLLSVILMVMMYLIVGSHVYPMFLIGLFLLLTFIQLGKFLNGKWFPSNSEKKIFAWACLIVSVLGPLFYSYNSLDAFVVFIRSAYP